jgi:hypothetical protein
VKTTALNNTSKSVELHQLKTPPQAVSQLTQLNDNKLTQRAATTTVNMDSSSMIAQSSYLSNLTEQSRSPVKSIHSSDFDDSSDDESMCDYKTDFINNPHNNLLNKKSKLVTTNLKNTNYQFNRDNMKRKASEIVKK